MDTNTIKPEHIHEETSVRGQDVQIAGGTSEATKQGDTVDKCSFEHGEPWPSSLLRKEIAGFYPREADRYQTCKWW
jgi:hypothetical protein